MAAAVLRICKLVSNCYSYKFNKDGRGSVFPCKPLAFSNGFSLYHNINKKMCVLHFLLENAPQFNRNGVHAHCSLEKSRPDAGTTRAIRPSVASGKIARVVSLAGCVSVHL